MFYTQVQTNSHVCSATVISNSTHRSGHSNGKNMFLSSFVSRTGQTTYPVVKDAGVFSRYIITMTIVCKAHIHVSTYSGLSERERLMRLCSMLSKDQSFVTAWAVLTSSYVQGPIRHVDGSSLPHEWIECCSRLHLLFFCDGDRIWRNDIL